MMQSPWLALTVTLAIFYVLYKLSIERRRARLAKRLGCLPARQYPHTNLFGHDLRRARVDAVRKGRRNDYDLELALQYGPTFIEQENLRQIVNTTEAANFRAVGATQFDDFGRFLPAGLHPLLGNCGRHTLNGAAWRKTRDLILPLFQRAALKDIEYFKKHVDKFLTLIPRDGKSFDMQPLLQKLFVDSATEFIFGDSIGCLDDRTPSSNEFLHAFHEAIASGAKRMYAGSFWSFFNVSDDYIANCAKVHAFVDEKIARYRQISANTTKARDRAKSHYVLIDGMAQQIEDPIQLRYHLLSVFMPAEHAMSTAVSNTMFLLARNPQVWQDLREEALKIRGQVITFEVLKSLHLFRYSLFEAIRLYGPSGATKRTALRDTTLPRGGGPDGSSPLFVPKGTGIFLNNFARMRDPEIWGEDILTFRPSRFEGKVLTWEFTPFFGGPRICPAINQVITQATYLLLRLVLEFDIENRDECLEYVVETKINVQSKNGVKVALHRRSER